MGKDIDEAASGFGNVFRDRLTYLMNGNNVYGKPVNTQELAAAHPAGCVTAPLARGQQTG